MNKKVLSAVLALLMVVGVLSGCGLTNAPETTVTIPSGDDNADGAPSVVDFNGYNYRIYSHGATNGTTVIVEELSTDVVDNAMYKRNEKIKQMYNVNISATEKGDAYLVASQYAGEDLADTYYVPERFHYVNASEYALNLRDISTLRLDRDYWNQDHNKNMTVNGVLQTAIGDIFASDEFTVTILALNNKLFKDLGEDVEEFQKKVIDGKWYYEDFYNYVKAGTRDLDGIPGMTTSDQYGLTTGYDIYWQLYNSAGLDVIEQDSDGDYKFTVDNEATLDALNVFADICTNRDYCQFAEQWRGNYDFKGMCTSFTKDHALFCTFRVYEMEYLRNMDSDYTILPFPKVYESLDRYYTVGDGFTEALWIPKTVSNPERTGLITDALGYYSTDYQGAVYDKVLMEKYARDPVSQSLLKLIFSDIKWQLDEQALIMNFRINLTHRWAEDRQGITAFASKTRNAITNAEENLKTIVENLENSRLNNAVSSGE